MRLSGAAANADTLLAPLAAEPALLLAVSGGPDSVALMLLAARWTQRPQNLRIYVATVDHGLRPQSLQEAQRVGDWARALGFQHRLLRWEGEKPHTRIQERAREARYSLLAACAREIDPACALVTAHHADDQAETILFRLCRGSGVAGLAGMARVSTLNGMKVLRPLLETPKAALEAICIAAGQPFLRDPSNENPKFARARLRALGATLAAPGLDREALLRLGRRAARAGAALEACAAQAQARALVELDASFARFDAETLRNCPREILIRLIEAQILRLGGGAPRLDRLERAAEAVASALEARTRARLTLAGVLIDASPPSLWMKLAPPRGETPRVRREAGLTAAKTS